MAWYVPLAADQRRGGERKRLVSTSLPTKIEFQRAWGPRTNQDMFRGSEINKAGGFIHLATVISPGQRGINLPPFPLYSRSIWRDSRWTCELLVPK